MAKEPPARLPKLVDDGECPGCGDPVNSNGNCSNRNCWNSNSARHSGPTSTDRDEGNSR